ncbi:prolyl oligopeptidase family serine peptidase [Sphingomonas sp. URHD0057]|uniref:prolyl oligopeptidase family serine peptidase n=1 Tax=Sphingomonas sp. URHD0057 TaxID=1380389 RepID=UPI000ADA9EC8
MRKLILAVAAAVLGGAALAQTATSDDPYLWLEDIDGPRAVAQVKQWNAATEALVATGPTFEQYRKRALAILDDEQQIAEPEDVLGNQVTNLWRDAKNPRGLWRIASLETYAAGKPQWRTLIDVDALGKAEGKSWVWHGANCLGPVYRRCLVSLSPGGTDADVVREFDIPSGKFVAGGFSLPDAKTNTSWADANHILVATDFGPGTLTSSGYARIVKLWARGTPLASAKTVFTAAAEDVSSSPFTYVDGDQRWSFVNRSKSTWKNDVLLVTAQGTAVPTPVPDTASVNDIVAGRLIATLNEPLGNIPAGALVAWPMADIAAGRSATPEVVMVPNEHQAIEEVAASKGMLWVKALDDVSGKMVVLWPRTAGAAWGSKAIPLPGNSTIHLLQTSDDRDLAFATVEGMLTPPTLYALTPNESPAAVQSLPARFDAGAYEVEQRFATSKDGTRVPYFLVTKRGTAGPVPTLIHAYGGFRVAQTPGYLTGQPYRAGPLALFWVEQGNAYVLANIRGGGEYGPRWHDAALREKRQNSFDDLHAVAEDVKHTGVASKVAISGRSNGGVLLGAALNQRPDLYSAAIIGSPLWDMKRYSHLLAGASWIDEYGDPDKPEQWAYLSKYSPYQNMRKDVRYPPVFIYGSTKDDRVHPGHARKAAARFIEYGNRVYFHEYMEGGHSVGADNAEDAKRSAMLLMYLDRELGGAPASRPGERGR